MSFFASHFWLWSIIGLVGLLLLYTLASLMNFAGFITPLKAFGQWLDRSPLRVRFALVAGLVALVAYPSVVHKLWADATAEEIRREFRALPGFPGAQQGEATEQMGGLYDPTGTEGAYVIGWFGAASSPGEVRAHYRRVLPEHGWVELGDGPRATLFLDQLDISRAHYELVVAVLGPGSAEIPPVLASHPTVFALRLGVVDPRLTTQVAWFVDCLVRRAPTFPSCEAMDWHPLEEALRSVPRDVRGLAPGIGR